MEHDPEPPRTSLGAYAKHREARYGDSCTKQAVHKAVKAGRLRVAVQRDEKGVPSIPDFDLADREWAAATDYGRHPDRLATDHEPGETTRPIELFGLRLDDGLIELSYTDPCADEEDGDHSFCIGLDVKEALQLGNALCDIARKARLLRRGRRW